MSVGVVIKTASTSLAVHDRVDGADLGPMVFGDRLGRLGNRVGHGHQFGAGGSGDGRCVHRADAPGAQQTKSQSHRNFLRMFDALDPPTASSSGGRTSFLDFDCAGLAKRPEAQERLPTNLPEIEHTFYFH